MTAKNAELSSLSFDLTGEGGGEGERGLGSLCWVLAGVLGRPAKCNVAVADCCFEFDASINIFIMRQENLT